MHTTELSAEALAKKDGDLSSERGRTTNGASFLAPPAPNDIIHGTNSPADEPQLCPHTSQWRGRDMIEHVLASASRNLGYARVLLADIPEEHMSRPPLGPRNVRHR